jgi:FMN phosphatase YigB (HAD superfamily)
MTQLAPVVFLLDVDNTLLDNDRIGADLKRHLTQAFGAERQERYWAIFEKPRVELGYADYLGVLQRYRAENPRGPHFLQLSFYLLDYPFANRLFPASLDVIEQLRSWGPTVILSDGDVVFQPRKIERSGLFEAVEGHVLIYIHKERELDDVEKHYPARHYVLVDDKLRILTAVKKVWGTRLTTVFPRQGHHAHDPKALATYPRADITIECIGDLLRYDLPALLAAGHAGTPKNAPAALREQLDAALAHNPFPDRPLASEAGLRDQLGIAVAGQTYETYRFLVDSPRWQRIFNAGARRQRLLWASTGTKDPEASDILYIHALAAPFTVNTMPEATLKALADHGDIRETLPARARYCDEVLAKFAAAGIDIDALAAQLLDDGAKSFDKSWNELLASIASKGETLKKAS